MININSASVSELDTLSGIGPTYAQKIVEHRPYSKPEDLVTSGAITQTLYEKIKNNITVY
jgi:competence protein ComEA